MKLFLNDAESLFARCLIESAHEKGHSVIAVRQQVSDENKSLSSPDKSIQSPQILTWNLASIFSIRLVLRQCKFLWGEGQDDDPITYVLLLQGNMLSASLFRDKLHEVHQKIEEQLYGQLVLLRELESQRIKVKSNNLGNCQIAFVILENNRPVELLGGSIYSALRYSYHHLLSTSNDANIYGFHSQNNNYESFSEFILNQLVKRSDKHIGKWLYFKDSWLSPSSSHNLINRWK